MELVSVPNTDLSVSRLCFGCWGIASDSHWGERDPQQSTATIHAALDAGVNFFDTAAVYGNGESETLLGKALGDRRADVVVASKVRPDMMAPDEVIRGCEESLQRLGTDYIDLFQTHWANPDVPLEESWAAVLKLKEQGKIRFAGVCNAGTGDMQRVGATDAPVTNQLPYNLIWRAIEDAILPACCEKNVGVLAYSPLMHGMLAGKYKSAAEVPDGRARSRHFSTEREMARHGESGCESETFAAIDAVRRIAEEAGRTMADVATNWVAQQQGVTSVIVGAASPDQLNANCESISDPLSSDVQAALTDVTSKLREALGPNPDMWQGTESSRYN